MPSSYSWKSFALFSIFIFLSGALVGVGLRGKVVVPSISEENVAIQEVALMIDRGDGHMRTFPHLPLFPHATVFGILNKASADYSFSLDATSYTGIGMFVKGIDGVENGDDGRYWQYWVNGEFAMVAADTYPLHGGEVILWKFAQEQEVIQ